MTDQQTSRFGTRGQMDAVEEGLAFQPKFDADGLIPAIVTAADTGEVLMFAWMNEEALALTLETGLGHFWSRSRRALWKKGEESGNLLQVVEMRTDCDQDVVWMRARVEGDGLACHTGRESCFYRSIPLTSSANAAVPLVPVQRNPRKP
jgi:phosphoribosyl-AMP cyclohydrolase